MNSIPLGNVAFKLLERVSFTPLVLVGIDPRPRQILVGFDGSEASTRAVEMTSNFFGDTHCAVMLLHVIRNRDKTGIKKARESIQQLLEDATRCLIGKGFDPNKITSKIITNAVSRAGAIIEEARTGGYGTIIVGRRGISGVHDFFMGRVCLKVVQLAEEQAVWVMN